MNPSPEILARLRKILALAESGIEGEKAAAQAKLAYLLAEHGLKPEDLDDAGPKARFAFSFRGKHEQALLAQVLMKVLCVGEIKWRVGRSKASIELTTAQWADAVTLWETVQKAWRKEWKAIQDAAVTAFITANAIFPPDDGTEKPSTLSEDEVARIRRMMASMDPIELRRRIEG